MSQQQKWSICSPHGHASALQVAPEHLSHDSAEVLVMQQATFDMDIKHAEVDEKKAQDVLAHASFERDKAIRKLKRGHVALERAQV